MQTLSIQQNIIFLYLNDKLRLVIFFISDIYNKSQKKSIN